MIKRSAPLLLVLLLAACNGAGGSATGGGPAVSAPVAATDDQLALASPPPPPGGLPPAALKGMSGAAIVHVLGKPSFVRRDPPAEIWQYRVKVCTLDLFLYEERGRLSVTHYTVRVPGGGFMGDVACLDEVLARRDGMPVS